MEQHGEDAEREEDFRRADQHARAMGSSVIEVSGRGTHAGQGGKRGVFKCSQGAYEAVAHGALERQLQPQV